MQQEHKELLKYAHLNRFKENTKYNQQLHSISLFPYANQHTQGTFFRIVLNLSLQDIDFQKKRSLPFFLAIELLSGQKCVATLSSRDILAWRLRKGMLVGCKVTLRNDRLYDFLDGLNLALPRMEKFKPINQNILIRNKTNNFTLKLSELVFFYPIELGLGINIEIRKLEINFLFNIKTKEEKIFLLTSNRIPIKIE